METYNSIDKEDLIKRARIILMEYQETLDMLDQVFGCVIKSSWNFGEISTFTNYMNHDQVILAKIEKYDNAFRFVDTVSNSINKVKMMYAEILILKYRENMTIDQISLELNLSRSSIFRYLKNAHVRFILVYEILNN